MTTFDDGGSTSDEGHPGRRDVVKLLAAASLAAIGLGAPEIARAAAFADATAGSQGTGVRFRPAFFTADEWPMVASIADHVIPRDPRSGSASDALVPEFMDFIMKDHSKSQAWMRDGLTWMNTESKRRFRRTWLKCSVAQQRQVLNDIAFPKTAAASFKDGVEFFTRFRDLTSSGFWSSRMGVKDLGYMGNTALAEWPGCPEPVLAKLGVSYKKSMHVPGRGQ